MSRDLKRKNELEDLLPEVVNTITLAITEDKKNKLKDQTNKDEICTKLIEYTEEGLPNKNEIQETIMPYYSIRNTITHIDGLIFKDQLLIVPNTLRKEIMTQAHAAYGGIGACSHRIRDIAYWPGINNDIENYITTSPYHPQGNGKAENAVKTTKRIFKKCNGSEQLAILEHNNTTTEELHLSRDHVWKEVQNKTDGTEEGFKTKT